MAVFDVCRRMTHDLSLYCYILLNVQKKFFHTWTFIMKFVSLFLTDVFVLFKYVFKHRNTLVQIIILAFT